MRPSFAATSLAAFFISGCNAPAVEEPQELDFGVPIVSNAKPDVAMCDDTRQAQEWEPEGSAELEIAEPFTSIAEVSETSLAVLTESGSTICVDRVWVSKIRAIGYIEDDRFLGIDWDGYEAFGYFFFDRRGDGVMFDTGAAPVFSPARERMAAIQISEVGWGGLEGVGIWDTTKTPIEPIFLNVADDKGDLPEEYWIEAGRWQFSRWVGESCFEVTATPSNTHPENALGSDQLTFAFAENEGWNIRQGMCD